MRFQYHRDLREVRNDMIREAALAGRKQSEIAKEHGVNPSLLTQILSKTERQANVQMQKALAFLERNGCTEVEARAAVQAATGSDATLAHHLEGFWSHKRTAVRNGIEFDFTFTTWVAKYGVKLLHRGKGHGKYCMGRWLDSGPYAPCNVRVITHDANLAEREIFNLYRKLSAQGLYTVLSIHPTTEQAELCVIGSRWLDEGDVQLREFLDSQPC